MFFDFEAQVAVQNWEVPKVSSHDRPLQRTLDVPFL